MKLERLGSSNKITLLLSLSIVICAIALSPISLAQEPSPFEIKIIPAADEAVTGQPFTYTVIVTNVSQIPVENTFVIVDVPEGTKFIDTVHTSTKWYGGTPFADPTIDVRQITLYTVERLESGEVFIFDMLVEILAEPDEEVSIEHYEIGSPQDETLTLSGPSIRTQVLAPSPTPSSTPISTSTPTQVPTEAVIAQIDDPSPTRSVEAATPTGTPNLVSQDNASENRAASTNGFWLLTFLIIFGLAGAATIIIWFVKK